MRAGCSVRGTAALWKAMLAGDGPREIQALGLGIKPGKLLSASRSGFFHFKINGVNVLHKVI